MLEYLSTGIPLNEIVSRITDEFQCAERTVYADYETRGTWMATLLQLDNQQQLFYDIINRHCVLIRYTQNLYTSSQNDSVRVATLKLLRSLNLDLFKMIIPSDLERRLTELETSQQRTRTRKLIS
jgi:hypothetical protein